MSGRIACRGRPVHRGGGEPAAGSRRPRCCSSRGPRGPTPLAPGEPGDAGHGHRRPAADRADQRRGLGAGRRRQHGLRRRLLHPGPAGRRRRRDARRSSQQPAGLRHHAPARCITSFAPSLNAQGLVVAASPDGSRIYVGGDFTTVNGQARSRVAAYSTATGALVDDVPPRVNGQVRAIAATNGTVYVGGSLHGRRRRDAAAGSPPSRRRTAPCCRGRPSAAPARRRVTATATPRTSTCRGPGRHRRRPQVVVGGRFDTLNGVEATGLGAVDAGHRRDPAVRGQPDDHQPGRQLRDLQPLDRRHHGLRHRLRLLRAGQHRGHVRGGPPTAALQWVNGCRGDTYSTFPVNGVLYSASHAHDCRTSAATRAEPAGASTPGPRTRSPGRHRSARATTATRSPAGRPRPAGLAPTLSAGSYTGQSQAAGR